LNPDCVGGDPSHCSSLLFVPVDSAVGSPYIVNAFQLPPKAVSVSSRGGFLIASYELDVERNCLHPTVLATSVGLVLDVDYSLGAIEAIERGNI